jgi:hypothetical protein
MPLFCPIIMIHLEVDNAVYLQARKNLEMALSTNPKTAAALRKIIRKVILEERKRVAAAARGKMEADPRGAAESVRTSVYKKVLGANINIFSSRKSGKTVSYTPPRKPSRIGGNRRPVSFNTRRINSYGPHDRGFILRFLNVGTHGTGPKGRQTIYGNRGDISARNWFQGAAQAAMEDAINNISTMIDNEFDKIGK